MIHTYTCTAHAVKQKKHEKMAKGRKFELKRWREREKDQRDRSSKRYLSLQKIFYVGKRSKKYNDMPANLFPFRQHEFDTRPSRRRQKCIY